MIPEIEEALKKFRESGKTPRFITVAPNLYREIPSNDGIVAAAIVGPYEKAPVRNLDKGKTYKGLPVDCNERAMNDYVEIS